MHVAVDLACTQAGAGHEVIFASSSGSYESLLRSCGVEVVTVPDTGIGRTALAVLSIARRVRPDVIHAHMMTSAVLGFGASLIVGAPLVTTMHNSFDRHSVLMRLGRVVVAVSEAERRLLLSRGYPGRRVVTVLNGAVNSPRETLGSGAVEPLDKPCVVSLSGLHARKAVSDLVLAFAEVVGQFPDWHLNIIGDGPDRSQLEDMVTGLGLDGSVHFVGFTLTPRPLLEQAEIFASASVAEPFGLAVAEARAAGCAVVATAVGGVPEVLDHGRAGLLTPPSDPSAMAAAFRTLMGSPDVLRTWRDRALAGADHFAVRRMADDYIQVYRSVIAPTRSTTTRGMRTVPTEDSRVRVAYFVPPSPDLAGVERVVHEIATGLMEAHGDILDVHVLFSTRYEDDLLTDTRYTLHVLDVERLRSLASGLRACVAAQDFDILICPQVEPSVVAWLATRGLRLPIFVSHLHGNPRIEEGAGSLRTRIAFGAFRHLVSRRISGVLAVSPSLRQYAAASVTRHAPVYFTKNPARDLGETTARPSRTDDRFRFLNVARLSRQKGLDVLLRALALARADLPPVILTMVGSGPDESDLKRLSHELGVDDIVDFAGYTADPAGQFSSADCFVLSSRWEGFPLVLLEALHFGLPLLATNCDFGPSDLITDPRIGDLVEVENPAALAEGLKRAVLRTPDPDHEAFRRSTAGGYARAEASEMHLDVLRQIVAAQPTPSGRLTALVAK